MRSVQYSLGDSHSGLDHEHNSVAENGDRSDAAGPEDDDDNDGDDDDDDYGDDGEGIDGRACAARRGSIHHVPHLQLRVKNVSSFFFFSIPSVV